MEPGEIVYYLFGAAMVAGLVYLMVRVKRWTRGAREELTAAMQRFAHEHGLEIDYAGPSLRGTVQGVRVTLDRDSIPLRSREGNVGPCHTLQVTVPCPDGQRWQLSARYLIPNLTIWVADFGEAIPAKGDPEFHRAYELRAEPGAEVLFLGQGLILARLREQELYYARAAEGRIELHFPRSSPVPEALGPEAQLEAVLQVALAVHSPARAAELLGAPGPAYR